MTNLQFPSLHLSNPHRFTKDQKGSGLGSFGSATACAYSCAQHLVAHEWLGLRLASAFPYQQFLVQFFAGRCTSRPDDPADWGHPGNDGAYAPLAAHDRKASLKHSLN